LELNTNRLIIQNAEHNEPQHGTEHDKSRFVGWARRKIIVDQDLDWNAGAGSCLSSHKSLPVMYLNFLHLVDVGMTFDFCQRSPQKKEIRLVPAN
jgi:hypothetical protein